MKYVISRIIIISMLLVAGVSSYFLINDNPNLMKPNGVVSSTVKSQETAKIDLKAYVDSLVKKGGYTLDSFSEQGKVSKIKVSKDGKQETLYIVNENGKVSTLSDYVNKNQKNKQFSDVQKMSEFYTRIKKLETMEDISDELEFLKQSKLFDEKELNIIGDL